MINSFSTQDVTTPCNYKTGSNQGTDHSLDDSVAKDRFLAKLEISEVE